MSIKKIILSLVLCLIVSTCFVPQAMALDITTVGDNSEIRPLMEYINTADYQFSITDGVAEMYAVVSGHASLATKCEITIELQEKGLLLWDTVDTWTTSASGRRTELNVSKVVTAGEKYRMITTVTVWSDTESEMQTMTSSVIRA